VVTENGQMARLRIGTFRNGSLQYVGFVADPQGDSLAEQEQMRVTLRCATQGHLYDIRRRKALGKRSDLPLVITPGIAEFFSLLPYSVDRCTVSVQQGAVRVGSVAAIAAEVSGPTEDLGPHVLAIRVTDANGRPRPEHDRNILADGGRGEAELPIALNDPRGEWTVEVRDVATGMSGREAFTVRD